MARQPKASTRDTQAAPKRRGRPPKARPADMSDMEASFEPAAVRRPARQPARDSVRDTMAVTPRKGTMVVEGRNGEQLTRRRTQVGDPYHVPPNEIPDGWSYQWNPVSVTGKEVIDMQNVMYENGWRPVPANRHPGRWTRPGDTGSIVVEGLRLEERPEALTDWALQEGEQKARAQIRDQADIFKLSKKMPDGFKMADKGQQQRFKTGGVNISIDRSMEISPGGYDMEDGE
jgi:hypothetical protein